MDKKKYIIYNFSVIIILSVIAIVLIIRLEKNKGDTGVYIAEEKVSDECTEEVIYSESEVVASSTELKLSPNASLVIVKHYDICNHTIKEYAEILPEMVNKNQEEIEQMYPNFNLQSFDKNELIVEKEEKGFCNEHYILRDDNGTIIVNSIDENDEETLYDRTSISTEYLTQTDIINLKDGIKVYGRENLNSLIEDYE